MTGGTGRCGGAVAAALALRGLPARLLTRRPGSAAARALAPLAELARGDLLRPATLERAMRGVRGAYLVTPPSISYEEEIACGTNFIASARKAGLSRLVFQSVLYADLPMPLHATKGVVERELRSSGVPYVILRPGVFLEPSLQALFAFALAGRSTMPSQLRPERRLSWVSVRDVGEAAAEALTRPGLEGRRFDVASPEQASLEELAAVVRAELGTAPRLEFDPRGIQDTGFRGLAPASVLRRAGYPVREDYYHPINRRTIPCDAEPAMRDLGVRFLSPRDYVRRVCRELRRRRG